MSLPPLSRLAWARSLLFVPGDRPERFAKALASGADLVILDLEDAVAPDRKAGARDAIRQVWPTLSDADRGRLLLRSNPSTTADWTDDLALLSELQAQGLLALMLPKAESAAALRDVAAQLPGQPIIPLIESALGFMHLSELAATPQVARLALGHLDLQADLGMACGPDEAELAPARWALLTASRCQQLPAPIDGVTAAVDDADALRRDIQRSKRFGFGAKMCIHPKQIDTVHQTLRASAEEQAWAQRVLDAVRQATGGAIRVDGAMVDAPVIRMAERILHSTQGTP